MKYKVGDRVKIRSDLNLSEEYGNNVVVPEMIGLLHLTKFILTVKEICGDFYIMKEGNTSYYWTDEMIEGKVEDMLTYKGWAILKMIADGKIKEGTKFKTSGCDCNIIYKMGDLVYETTKNPLDFNIINANRDFEIIEEQEEINIQEIKETKADEHGYLQTHLGAFKGRKMDLAFNDRINELVQAVKALDKKIKEKE